MSLCLIVTDIGHGTGTVVTTGVTYSSLTVVTIVIKSKLRGAESVVRRSGKYLLDNAESSSQPGKNRLR